MTEKEKKKSKKKAERKRIATQSKDTDNEWETESERAINELSIGSQESILNDKRIKLFEDSPEKTRDKPNTYEEILSESPIIQSSRNRLHLISKKHDIFQDELLPVNLLQTEIQNPEESNEDETIFRTCLTLNRIFAENSCRNSITQLYK